MCFFAAKLAVSIKNGKSQADYFVIFTKTQHETKDCVIYGNFQMGDPHFTKEKTRLYDKAPRCNRFNGHQDIKQTLISTFFNRKLKLDQRLLRIWGKPGVGKSALAQHTTNYCQTRCLFEGGCIYINCDHTIEMVDFYHQIIDRLINDSSKFFEQFATNMADCDERKSEEE